MSVLRFPPMAGNRLDAATDWLLAETGEPASISVMREAAKRELKRPRDDMHKVWAEEFLSHTEQYANG